MTTTISPLELKKMIIDGSVVLVDVLLPEDFTCRRIGGAVNACVYEMTFLDRVRELVTDLDKPVVLYDESGTTLAARTAKEKLERAGYRAVKILEGGLKGWRDAGLEVESGDDAPQRTILDGTYRIDTEKSVVEWSGRNSNNRHHGRITISSGEVVMTNGLPVSGTVAIDMNSLTNSDLLDDNWRNMLLHHLKSDDFFDVSHYPAATFTLRGGVLIAGSTPGTPNVDIAGLLTIKDVSRPICIPAIIEPHENGSIKAHALLTLDRTLWNVCYGSGKLYERLGMHLVNDLISIEMFVVTASAT